MVPKTGDRQKHRYEQTLTIPQFLNLDKIQTSHRHGMRELTIPVEDAVKPRRIQITGQSEERKQLDIEQPQPARV